MRIAVFVPSFPTVSETFILRQVTGLIDLGHEVDIFAERSPEPGQPVHPEVSAYGLLDRTVYTDRDMPPASGYWQMPVWPVTGKTWLPGEERPTPNLRRVLSAAPTFLRCLLRAPRLTLHVLDPREYGYQAWSLSGLYRLAALSAQPGRYDVVHAHFGPQGNTFRFARALWGAPMVVSFHGFDFCTLPRTQGPDIYRKLFQTADVVTVNSGYTRGRLERLGCPPAIVRKLYVGLDPSRYAFFERSRPDSEPTRLLTVARLVEIKGHEFALNAVARVRQTHRDVRYEIVGDGPQRRHLEDLVRRLGLQDVVTFHGALDGEGVRRMMDSAHLFLLTSVTVEGDQEGQGLVLQEAQASGLPVIATDHGAFPEGMIPGHSGYLVPEWDVPALTGCLNQLIENPELWPGMGRAGRRYVENEYDVRRLNRRLEEIYRSAISGGRGERSRPSPRNSRLNKGTFTDA